MPICPTCGYNQPEHDTICSECGMDLGTASVGATQPSSNSLLNPNSSNKTVNLSKPPADQPTGAIVPKKQVDADIKYARLCYKRGGQLTGEEFQVGSHAVIGRFDTERGPVDVDLDKLPDADHISRAHAEIRETSPGVWVICDLGSRNGTFVRPVGQVNFEKVAEKQEYPIGNGDEIALGNVKFEFHPS